MKRAPRKGSFVWRMTRRLVKWTIVTVLLSIPAGYFGLPILVKSAWGRTRIEAALTKATGSTVHLNGASLSWCQGVTLRDLTIDASARGNVEFSGRAKEVVLSPKGKSLLCRTTLGRAVVIEPTVAIVMRSEPQAPVAGSVPKLVTACARKPLAFDSIEIRNGSVSYDTDSFNEPIVVSNITLEAALTSSAQGVTADIRNFRGTLNGGEVSGKGAIARINGAFTGKVEMDAASVALTDALTQLLRTVIPALDIAPGGDAIGVVHGYVQMDGLTGQAGLTLAGRMSGARVMHALAAATQESRLASMPLEGMMARLQIVDGDVTHLGTEMRTAAGALRLTGVVRRGGTFDMLLVADADIVAGMNPAAEAALIEGVRVLGTRAQPLIVLN